MTPAAAAGAAAAFRPIRDRTLFLGVRALVVAYLAAVVAFPVGLVVWRAVSEGLGPLWRALTDPEALAAFRLSFLSAAAVAAANAVFGTLAAIALVRIRFPGRRVLDALVDLPVALPTAVTGLTWAALLGPGSPLGRRLAEAGLEVLYRPPAIYLAFAVITLPFVIRAVEPLLLSMDPEEEEAATMLGAGPIRRFFWVVLPALRPGILSGAALVFARSLGEFGAVVFIAGTEPFRTQVAATFVYSRIESFDYRGAAAASLVVLASSYALLWGVRSLEARASRRPAR